MKCSINRYVRAVARLTDTRVLALFWAAKREQTLRGL
jgi:hypothetical protein